MNKLTSSFKALITFILPSLLLTGSTLPSIVKKPNILFIFADDQRADALGCAGNPYIQTPVIDQLAQEGVRFTRAYVMGGHHGAICMPSRAMLMSGKSLFNVYDKLDGVYTMPQHFAKHGYTTFGTGKWHNGGQTFEASFQLGKDVFLGGMSDHFKVPVRDLDENGKLGEPTFKQYSTDVFTDAAIQFLSHHTQTNPEKPFFCYVAYTVPHDPRSPHPDYLSAYPDGTIPIPGNYKPLPDFDHGDLTVRDEHLTDWPRSTKDIQASWSDYFALITHMDTQIDRIIQTLKSTGQYENTIIVYAADNGLAMGSHGLLGKQNLYEHSMKVPFIIAGPGIPKNEVSHAFIYLYDLFPTLATLSGLPLPPQVDGMDHSAVVKGNKQSLRASMFNAYRHTIRSVRTDEWKLILYPERDYTQVFNLKKDPLELHNLAGKSEYAAKEAELMALLKKWQKETHDTVTLTAAQILPMDYDPSSFQRKPDVHQPEYILNRYFRNND